MSKIKHNAWVVWKRNRWVKTYKKWGKWEEWMPVMAFKCYLDNPFYSLYSARDEARKWALGKYAGYDGLQYKILPEGREPK